jgi:hypothetical protein
MVTSRDTYENIHGSCEYIGKRLDLQVIKQYNVGHNLDIPR